ncbi:uncharacterized protein LOC104893860 [Beta vulgaris subsp. vulgaris]|uniref:uncharacterized protein LOC104893860 n=1 Tax=Beta vulgaris subsp. vulgaris TaxID=3555 RepID=UPI00254838A7|nr:uncharacterized protein LOC104893860 [Beta vulgaris subsp. vulgaris]
MLAYGVAAGSLDEYVRISESTSRITLMKFTKGVNTKFGAEYLRRPTPDDFARLLEFAEEHGFPSIIGSIDRMHWEWKNYPSAWKGQYQGRAGVATLVLEAVADRDLSTCILSSDTRFVQRPKCSSLISCATFIHSVTCPQTRKDKLFAQHQEGARKDVERAFGKLQSWFAIVRRLSLAWDEEILNDIMLSCIIMHNMIVEDERDTYAHYTDTT